LDFGFQSSAMPPIPRHDALQPPKAAGAAIDDDMQRP
jgi:hypothetical protein